MSRQIAELNTQLKDRERRLIEQRQELVAAYTAIVDAETAMTYATEGAYICKPVDDWEARHCDIRARAKDAINQL